MCFVVTNSSKMNISHSGPLKKRKPQLRAQRKKVVQRQKQKHQRQVAPQPKQVHPRRVHPKQRPKQVHPRRVHPRRAHPKQRPKQVQPRRMHPKQKPKHPQRKRNKNRAVMHPTRIQPRNLVRKHPRNLVRRRRRVRQKLLRPARQNRRRNPSHSSLPNSIWKKKWRKNLLIYLTTMMTKKIKRRWVSASRFTTANAKFWATAQIVFCVCECPPMRITRCPCRACPFVRTRRMTTTCSAKQRCVQTDKGGFGQIPTQIFVFQFYLP